MAGRAEPGRVVEIFDGGQKIGEVTSDERGGNGCSFPRLPCHQETASYRLQVRRYRRHKDSVGDKCGPGCAGAGRGFPGGSPWLELKTSPSRSKCREAETGLAEVAAETNGLRIRMGPSLCPGSGRHR